MAKKGWHGSSWRRKEWRVDGEPRRCWSILSWLSPIPACHGVARPCIGTTMDRKGLQTENEIGAREPMLVRGTDVWMDGCIAPAVQLCPQASQASTFEP
eukprot:scaffold684_cov345-Pavlova_lutheri.AAC.76